MFVLLVDDVECDQGGAEAVQLTGVQPGMGGSHHGDGEAGGETGEDVWHCQGALSPLSLPHTVGQPAVTPAIWSTLSEILKPIECEGQLVSTLSSGSW